jgi:hypothetical protein
MDSLRFHPAARAELIEALIYLDEHRPGYGDRFAAEVEELIERIVQLPESGAPLSGYPRNWMSVPIARRRFDMR